MIISAPLSLAIVALERRAISPLLRAAFVTGMTGVLVLALAASGSLFSIMGSDDVTGLNGRTDVWDQSIATWRTSPILGAGQSAFGEDFRQRTGLTFAGQAHNQFFQSLASEGLLGVVLLVPLILILGRAAMRNQGVTRGASSALLVTFLANLSTEAPLRATRWSSSLLVFLCVAAVALCNERADGAGERHADVGPMDIRVSG
jgi:O-antigen ligase